MLDSLCRESSRCPLRYDLRRELDFRTQAIDESMTLALLESDATVEVFYARATEQSHDSSPDHRDTKD